MGERPDYSSKIPTTEFLEIKSVENPLHIDVNFFIKLLIGNLYEYITYCLPAC